LHSGVNKLDKYFRRKETPLTRILNAISSIKGEEYLKSPERRKLELTISLLFAFSVGLPVVTVFGLLKQIEDGGPMLF